jgi:hypothetical protein
MIAVPTLRYTAAWLALMMLFAMITGGFNWPTYWRLAHHSASVQGTVIQVLPKMHATAQYHYNVDGQEYQGQAQPRPPNPTIERLTDGATVTVWYDPEQPKMSVLGLPSGLLKNETISVLLTAILAPTFILLAWRYRTRQLVVRNRRC